MAQPHTTSFLDLPTELRIQIYTHCLNSLDRLLTSARLKHHYGLLLSCSQIFSEVEYILLKETTHSLQRLQSSWTTPPTPLLFPPLEKLSDTINIPIDVPQNTKTIPGPMNRLKFVKPLIDVLIAHSQLLQSVSVGLSGRTLGVSV
ncbi:hypothetical protein CC86DRAFT_74581 [Ophiobolus disseminans]|uniref:Uncharacterized protein n=1 Tax=Ophiobolus disseminans TaxID=1469910 RepID=A0A6A6ZPI0_9PLEO|nr:hypothetical protein CC86DRAFT_74581 [Ophiobolus disseminans]